jgi:hypothetical protein
MRSGPFHGIGARLLRDYAAEIGLNPAFTIHDREDSAALMNLMRHELGFSKTETRFPMKSTCLAIYSRCVNAELPIVDVLATSFPWCSTWAAELKQLFAAYVEAKQRQQRFFTHGQNPQGDRHVYASRTRFIPAGLLELFEQTAWPMVAPGPDARLGSQGVRVDVRARMRSMWR